LYDIVKNTFDDVKILDYNIDSKDGKNELHGYLKMGRALGYSIPKTLIAYQKAKKAQAISDYQKFIRQQQDIDSSGDLKILIVSHPYNTYDKLIGFPISDYIKKLGGLPLYADITDRKESVARSREISQSLYWLYNKELVGSIKLLEDKIDGIILLTAFPCGPDSLVNELIMRKSKKVPTINIILDELQGEAGLQTRIESFMDIIRERAHSAESIA
jgi:predicted nucleotide-binding protein (sugar kinase/HSP70/actin superfamily)